MKQIPSAEEFLKANANDISYEEGVMFAADVTADILIEFAKLHVQAALEAAVTNAKINIEARFKGENRNSQSDCYFYDFKEMGGKREIRVHKDSILNSYDLNLIQ